MTLPVAYGILIFFLIFSFMIGVIVNNIKIIDQCYVLKLISNNVGKAIDSITKTIPIIKTDDNVIYDKPVILQSYIVK